MYRIILSFVLCSFALTEARITSCDSSIGYVDPNNVRISGCHPDDEICFLQRGTDVALDFDFTVYKDVQSVTAIVHGKLWFLSVPFPLPDADVCMYSFTTQVHCPLDSHRTYHYTTSLPVSDKYPTIGVTVKWELQDENGENIACLEIPSELI